MTVQHWHTRLFHAIGFTLAIACVILAVPFGKVNSVALRKTADVTTTTLFTHRIAQAVTATRVLITRRYIVRAGDTLSAVARRFYGNPDDWGYLYRVNHIPNPNLIYIGQTLLIPPMPARYTPLEYTPQVVTDVKTTRQPAAVRQAAPSIEGGRLSCSGLQQLWDSAGGDPSRSFMAAEIAEAESGGSQYATHDDSNGSVDEGYWQINTVNGAYATYNALGNAESAVALSHDGTDWEPWVTYQTGAYSGLC
jgi:LysM repeat protein